RGSTNQSPAALKLLMRSKSTGQSRQQPSTRSSAAIRKWPLVRRGACARGNAGMRSMAGERLIGARGWRMEDRGWNSDRDLRSSIFYRRLLLPRLPDFERPLLHFFLLLPHGGIGVGESVLFAEAAPLLRQHFAEGHVVAQRGAVEVGNQIVGRGLAFPGQEPVDEKLGPTGMRRVGEGRDAAARARRAQHALFLDHEVRLDRQTFARQRDVFFGAGGDEMDRE